MPQIVTLSVSLHPTLLETRSRVLRTGGYTVISTASVVDAATKFLAGDFDLVILCHSIPARDRRYLVARIRDHSPSTPLVLVSATESGHDASLDATIGNDPEQLLQELARVLRQREQRTGTSDD